MKTWILQEVFMSDIPVYSKPIIDQEFNKSTIVKRRNFKNGKLQNGSNVTSLDTNTQQHKSELDSKESNTTFKANTLSTPIIKESNAEIHDKLNKEAISTNPTYQSEDSNNPLKNKTHEQVDKIDSYAVKQLHLNTKESTDTVQSQEPSPTYKSPEETVKAVKASQPEASNTSDTQKTDSVGKASGVSGKLDVKNISNFVIADISNPDSLVVTEKENLTEEEFNYYSALDQLGTKTVDGEYKFSDKIKEIVDNCKFFVVIDKKGNKSTLSRSDVKIEFLDHDKYIAYTMAARDYLIQSKQEAERKKQQESEQARRNTVKKNHPPHAPPTTQKTTTKTYQEKNIPDEILRTIPLYLRYNIKQIIMESLANAREKQREENIQRKAEIVKEEIVKEEVKAELLKLDEHHSFVHLTEKRTAHKLEDELNDMIDNQEEDYTDKTDGVDILKQHHKNSHISTIPRQSNSYLLTNRCQPINPQSQQTPFLSKMSNIVKSNFNMVEV